MGFFESDKKKLEKELRKRDKLNTKIGIATTKASNRERKEELQQLRRQEKQRKREIRAEQIASFKQSSANAGARAKVLGGKLKRGASTLRAVRIRGSPLRSLKHKVFKK